MRCNELLPGLRIGKTNEVFQIDGRRQDLLASSVEDAERVRATCSATLTGLDCTGDLANDSASSKDIRFTSSTPDKSSSMKSVCTTLMAIILGEVWGLHVKVLPSFFAV